MIATGIRVEAIAAFAHRPVPEKNSTGTIDYFLA